MSKTTTIKANTIAAILSTPQDLAKATDEQLYGMEGDVRFDRYLNPDPVVTEAAGRALKIIKNEQRRRREAAQ